MPCDVLIMESTYGRKDYVFPPQEEVLKEFFDSVFDWTDAGGVPVVLAYRMGKTQELAAPSAGSRGYRVALEEGAYEVTRSLRGGGGEVSPFTRISRLRRHSEGRRGVDISRRDAEPKRRCRASGTSSISGCRGGRWTASGPIGLGADVSFPFSDHADYEELLAYVEAVGAKEVYTVYGFPDLARDLRARGYEARHLEKGSSSVQLKFA